MSRVVVSNVKRLMENGPLHWTDLAVCGGDDRFTGRFEWLSDVDRLEMAGMCAVCPVFDECAEWADVYRVVDVFAAGCWRD